MITHLVLKELSEHLKTLRFILMFSMVSVLMAVSAILYIPEYNERQADYHRNKNTALAKTSEQASQTAAIFRVFSFNYEGTWVFKRPNHLGFISDGKDRELPNAFRPSAFRVYGPSRQERSNLLLWRSQALDWSLIIGVVLSFFALVLSYDGLSGEREKGTLRLCLSNAIPRITVVISKFLGGFIAISVALIAGILIHLIILTAFGSIQLAASDWAVIAVSFSISLIYISLFTSLGLLISACTRESSTSLVIALICWAMLVVIIPGSGGYIATRLMQVPQQSQVLEQANRMEREVYDAYTEKNPELKRAGRSGHWSPGEPLGRALLVSDAWTGTMNEYHNQLFRQVELARNATLISPYVCYSLSLEILTESGIAHYRNFYDQIQDYRLTMRRYLTDVYPVPLDWWWGDQRGGTYEDILQPLDFNSIPKFQEQRSELREIAHNALPYFFLLVLYAVVFFSAGFVAFNRYDVR